jgi:X-Pro dipeptidyl-peptidase
MHRITRRRSGLPRSRRSVAGTTIVFAALGAALGPARLHAFQAAEAGPEPTAGAATDTTVGPIFRQGIAQVVPALSDPTRWIRHDLWVETEFDSDGDGRPDRVHVDVTRPVQTDSAGLRVPVVYETSPYYAGTGSPAREYFWDIRQELGGQPTPRTAMPPISPQRLRPVISESHVADWVPRGFAVVHSESPGTGLSQGCPTVGGPNESLAPKAVIDWLNGRARGFTTAEGDEEVEAFWSTGKVGMTGTSYGGTLPIAAATTGVEGLEAIIPIAPNTSYYHYYRSNGLVRSPGGWPGEDVDVLYDFINSGDPARRAYCAATVRDGAMAQGRDRVSGDYNDFWAGRDYLNAIDGVRAATLMAHAFNDWNVMPEHSYRIYDALRARGVPVQAYYHQGGHGGPPPLDQMNRWFTRYLYGVDNGVESEPRAWIVREGEDPRAPTPYADYPNPEAEAVSLHLGAGGNAVGLLTVERPPEQGAERLTDDFELDGATLAAAPASPSRLLYATPELARPVHISGVPRVTVRVAANRSAANLSVWLVALPWTDGAAITDNVITRGWADPQNHASLTDGEPLEPGRFYDVTFDLQPDDQVIPAGSRVGLMIFSSDRDFTLWPDPGTELTIDLDGTSIQLPIVGGAEALSRPVG